MTRYARAGNKGTHSRVAKDPTPWDDMKPPAPERRRGSKDDGGKRKPPNKFKKERFSRQKPQQDEGSAPSSTSQERPQGGGDQRGPPRRPNNFNSNIRGFGQSKSIKVFGQFWVPLEDGKRLKNLVKKLKEQGLPRKEISEILKNDRRKAEKASKRQRDKTCFQCRQFGHILSDCPNLKNASSVPGSGTEDDGSAEMSGEICFKCGSTEHTSRSCRKKGENFSFAKCFICSGSGHIARQCPKNTRGIYPSGGSCGECGSLNHLKKDCPDLVPVEHNGSRDDDQDTMTLPMADPFSSTEYEPMTIQNDDNDNEKGDEDNDIANDNHARQEKVMSSKPKLFNKKPNKKNGKRKMDAEMDSATFEFGLSAAPPTKPTPPAKRKIVKF